MNQPDDNTRRENLLNLLRATKGKLRSRLRTLFTHPPDYRAPKAREIARRHRRTLLDLKAAAANYSGWCSRTMASIHLF